MQYDGCETKKGGLMDISDIVVGKRHRTDLGDIDILSQSIADLGLLQPIVVKKGTNELVAGFRRLYALKKLGVTKLIEGTHVHHIDISSIIRGEYDENVCRKDFTISEKVAIFEAMKEEQKRFSVARQVIQKKKPSENNRATCAEPGHQEMHHKSGRRNETGNSRKPGSKKDRERAVESARSHAARSVGLHYNTLRKATEIVSAARKEPRRYGHLVQEMDSTGKVDPIFQKYMQEKSRPAADGRLSQALEKFMSDPEITMPEFYIDALSRVSFKRQEEFLQRYANMFQGIKRSDIERSIRTFSKGKDIEKLSENDILQMLGSILERARATAQEWVFLPQVRQVAAIMMNVAKAQEPVAILDKLDFFMIGLAGFIDMACSYLQVANKDGILKTIPDDVLEKYLSAIDAFQMLYESKLPRQVGALRMKENEKAGNSNPDMPTIRDHVNAMKANEMITDAAEGSAPYYRNLIAELIQDFREGAQKLKPAHLP